MSCMAKLKKVVTGVLAFFCPHVLEERSARQAYSVEVRDEGRDGLRFCWTDFFEHSRR